MRELLRFQTDPEASEKSFSDLKLFFIELKPDIDIALASVSLFKAHRLSDGEIVVLDLNIGSTRFHLTTTDWTLKVIC